MSNWTSGPWVVRQWEGSAWPQKRTSIAEQFGNGEALFINARYGKNVEANAHLIAAAPELFEALDRLITEGRAYQWHDMFQPMIRDARAALAKAKGEDNG